MALRKVADIKLGDDEFQLAKNGRYCLTFEAGRDAYGDPYYMVRDADQLTNEEVNCLIDLVGQQTEELAKLRVAVGRSEQ